MTLLEQAQHILLLDTIHNFKKYLMLASGSLTAVSGEADNILIDLMALYEEQYGDS